VHPLNLDATLPEFLEALDRQEAIRADSSEQYRKVNVQHIE
jgi:hypothetical protein